LQESFNQTMDALYDLPQEYLQQPCAHGCARGGTARDLPTLLAEYHAARAQPIAALFGLADPQLDAKPTDEGWTVRETIEHVLHSDRDSIDTLQAEHPNATGQTAPTTR
jgi:hypothetical protein